MTRRRKTDGERIAAKVWERVFVHHPMSWEADIARDIDRIIRRRMAEAWDLGHGWGVVWCDPKANPYQGRAKK